MSAVVADPLESVRLKSRGPQTDPSKVVTPEEFFRTIRYVTLKLTNGCNLKCSYCNVDADVPSTPRMEMDRYKRIARLLIENSTAPEVVLEFHGGEPLILPDEWFEEAVTFAAELGKKHGKKVEHPMQTNGTRLDEKRLAFLRKLGIMIGFSFDGTPEINDKHRMAGKRVEKTIKMMVEKEESFGLILVLSHSNKDHMYEIMEYFRGIGIRDYRVNFMQPQGLGLDHDLLTGEEMFRGMKGIFDHMADTDCSVMEGDMQMVVNRFISGRDKHAGLSCWEHQCQAGRIYVAINYMGDVHACGTDMFHHRLGHIDEDFDREVVGKTLCQLHKKDEWYLRCFNCEAKRICNLSCPTSDYNNLEYREAECEYTRMLHTYLSENPERVDKVYKAIGEKMPGGNHHR